MNTFGFHIKGKKGPFNYDKLKSGPPASHKMAMPLGLPKAAILPRLFLILKKVYLTLLST